MRKLKSYMMPVAMLTGIVFYKAFNDLAFLTPCLIFVMLLLTYNGLSLRTLSPTPMHLWLLAIQVFGSVLLYHLTGLFDPIVAQAALICVLAPTATAAPVIAAMLKGNVASLTTYSLLSNLSVACSAPVIFSYVGSHQDIPFVDSFVYILRQVFVLLLTPFVAAIVIRKVFPPLTEKIRQYSGWSFYLWVAALAIVTGKTVFFIAEQNKSSYLTELLIALSAMIACAGQFWLGRRIGSRYRDTVAGGQGLGQKNTILAIWMAQVYLNPVASLGPGAYVLWQNLINAFQLWRENKKQKTVKLKY